MNALTHAQVELLNLASTTDEDLAKVLTWFAALSPEAGGVIVHASIPVSKTTMDTV